MSNKLLKRFNDFVDNQTEEPTKEELVIIVKQFCKDKKYKEKKAKEEEKKAVEKPKRKPSAYNEFYKAESAKLKEKELSLPKEEHMTANAKMAYISNLWKQLKQEEEE